MQPRAKGSAAYDAYRAEYVQRRNVERLQQLVFSQADPRAAGPLLAELAEADRTLRSLTEQTLSKEAAQGSGKLATVGAVGKGIDVGDRHSRGGPAAGTPEPDRPSQPLDVEVRLRMSHVPTGIVHLLDPQERPLVTFALRNHENRERCLRLRSRIEGYSAEAVTTVRLAPGATSEHDQLPTLFPSAIEGVRELTRATLHITIDNIDGTTELENTYPLWLLARTTAYNAVRDPTTGTLVDLTPYYAAWVTPNEAQIHEVVRRAADLHNISGYQTDELGVRNQVRAVYTAVKLLDLKYVNTVVAFGAGEGESLQRVRLPRESLTERSANCMDGTVLMASALEAASLNPGIVFVPGHAFLAWQTQPAGSWDFLETVMIGTHDFDSAREAGRTMAEQFQITEPLSILDLRTERGITPMQ